MLYLPSRRPGAVDTRDRLTATEAPPDLPDRYVKLLLGKLPGLARRTPSGTHATRAGWSEVVRIGTVPPRVAGARSCFEIRVRSKAWTSLSSDNPKLIGALKHARFLVGRLIFPGTCRRPWARL